MSSLTTYATVDGVSVITLDDGKVNALSPAMLAEIQSRLVEAEAAGVPVVLTGRAQTLSAGFDLRTPPEGWPGMLVGGARLAERLLSYPLPTVVACNGNAIAMGGFTLLSADHRVGADGDFRIGLNEVAIGMTAPWFAIAIARYRLTRTAYDHCLVTGELLRPQAARDAGFLDAVVAPDELHSTALAAAQGLAGVNFEAHAATKLRLRADVLAGIRDGIERIEQREQPEW